MLAIRNLNSDVSGEFIIISKQPLKMYKKVSLYLFKAFGEFDIEMRKEKLREFYLIMYKDEILYVFTTLEKAEEKYNQLIRIAFGMREFLRGRYHIVCYVYSSEAKFVMFKSIRLLDINELFEIYRVIYNQFKNNNVIDIKRFMNIFLLNRKLEQYEELAKAYRGIVMNQVKFDPIVMFS